MFCNGDVEEGAHLFIKCKYVKEIWVGMARMGLEEVRNELAQSNSVVCAPNIIWTKPLEKRGADIDTMVALLV
jgi:hypothetical protein